MNSLNENAQNSSRGMSQIKVGINKLNKASLKLKDIVQETSIR